VRHLLVPCGNFYNMAVLLKAPYQVLKEMHMSWMPDIDEDSQALFSCVK